MPVPLLLLGLLLVVKCRCVLVRGCISMAAAPRLHKPVLDGSNSSTALGLQDNSRAAP